MDYIFIIIESIFFFVVISLLIIILFIVYCKRRECNLTMSFNIQMDIICLIHISSFFMISSQSDSILCKLQSSLPSSSLISILLFYNEFILTSFLLLKFSEFTQKHILAVTLLSFSFPWISFIAFFICLFFLPTYHFTSGVCITNSDVMRIIIALVLILLLLIGLLILVLFLLLVRANVKEHERNKQYAKRFLIILCSLILVSILISALLIFRNKIDNNLFYFLYIFLIETNNLTIIIGLGYNQSIINEFKSIFYKQEDSKHDTKSIILLLSSDTIRSQSVEIK